MEIMEIMKQQPNLTVAHLKKQCYGFMDLAAVKNEFGSKENFLASSNTSMPISPFTSGKSASGVASKAQAIVDMYEGVDDTERLTKYGDEICRLVSYNYNAAANYSAASGGEDYGDPWQLIWK